MRLATTPYITSDGAIASLIGLAPRDKIKQSNNVPKHIGSNASVRLSASKVSVDVVASMGFGSMIDVNAGFNAVYFMVELGVAEEPVPGAPDSIIKSEFYGVSIRICVKAWNVSAEASANLALVSSNVMVSAASVAYQVDVIGVRTSDIASLPGLISSSIGPFDVSKLQTVGAVYSDLVNFIIERSEECRPELLAVDVDLKELTMPFQDSSSGTFGLGRIAAGLSFQDAIKIIPPIDPAYPPVHEPFVRELYLAIVDTIDNPPNQTQSAEAKTILGLGNWKK